MQELELLLVEQLLAAGQVVLVFPEMLVLQDQPELAQQLEAQLQPVGQGE